MAQESMTVHLKVWRQAGPEDQGEFRTYTQEDVNPDMSFLELLDVINEGLVKSGEDPIEFDSDCREGICGTCGCMVNGQAHGPERGTTVCQLHMRVFRHGETIVVEPWRAEGYPVIKDLVVDRTALDRIIAAGGYVSVKTGPKPDANSLKIPKPQADAAFDAAACIGCGACVAACPNASASLFTGAKISHLAMLPQGKAESTRRAKRMVEQMDEEGFGACSNIGECEAACPKEISIDVIARMRREYLKSMFSSH
jgi:succinate dehydrogenase / fumarate reductase, iron-sulfur subunit